MAYAIGIRGFANVFAFENEMNSAINLTGLCFYWKRKRRQFYEQIVKPSLPRRLELASQIHPDLEIEPLGGRIFFLVMIGTQNQMTGGKQNLLHVRVLL